MVQTKQEQQLIKTAGEGDYVDRIAAIKRLGKNLAWSITRSALIDVGISSTVMSDDDVERFVANARDIGTRLGAEWARQEIEAGVMTCEEAIARLERKFPRELSADG